MTARRVFKTYVCPRCGLVQRGVPACASEVFHHCFSARRDVRLVVVEEGQGEER